MDFLYYSINNFDEMPAVINVGVGKDYSVLDYYNIIAKNLGRLKEFAKNRNYEKHSAKAGA